MDEHDGGVRAIRRRGCRGHVDVVDLRIGVRGVTVLERGSTPGGRFLAGRRVRRVTHMPLLSSVPLLLGVHASNACARRVGVGASSPTAVHIRPCGPDRRRQAARRVGWTDHRWRTAPGVRVVLPCHRGVSGEITTTRSCGSRPVARGGRSRGGARSPGGTACRTHERRHPAPRSGSTRRQP